MCFVSISLNISDNKPLLRMYTSTQLTYLMSSRYHGGRTIRRWEARECGKEGGRGGGRGEQDGVGREIEAGNGTKCAKSSRYTIQREDDVIVNVVRQNRF